MKNEYAKIERLTKTMSGFFKKREEEGYSGKMDAYPLH